MVMSKTVGSCQAKFVADHILFFFFFFFNFSAKLSLDFSYELSPQQMIYENCQDLFSLKKKKIKMLSTAVVIWNFLRVKADPYHYLGKPLFVIQKIGIYLIYPSDHS